MTSLVRVNSAQHLRETCTNILRGGDLKVWNNEVNKWRPVNCILLDTGLFQWCTYSTKQQVCYRVDIKPILLYFVYSEMLLRLPGLPLGVSAMPLNRVFALPHKPSLTAEISYFLCKNTEELSIWVQDIISILKHPIPMRVLSSRKTSSYISDIGSSVQSSSPSITALPQSIRAAAFFTPPDKRQFNTFMATHLGRSYTRRTRKAKSPKRPVLSASPRRPPLRRNRSKILLRQNIRRSFVNLIRKSSESPEAMLLNPMLYRSSSVDDLRDRLFDQFLGVAWLKH